MRARSHTAEQDPDRDRHVRLHLWLALVCLCLMLSSPPSVSAQRGDMTASYIAQKVSTVYGDPKPRLMHVETSQTETSPHEMMYFIKLTGTFQRGRVHARYLYFSALATRWYVWGVQGYDRRHHLRWIDATVRTR